MQDAWIQSQFSHFLWWQNSNPVLEVTFPCVKLPVSKWRLACNGWKYDRIFRFQDMFDICAVTCCNNVFNNVTALFFVRHFHWLRLCIWDIYRSIIWVIKLKYLNLHNEIQVFRSSFKIINTTLIIWVKLNPNNYGAHIRHPKFSK